MTSSFEPTTITGTVDDQDVINRLAGIAPGSSLARLRAEKADAQRYAQGSYLALLEPEDPAGVSLDERDMIALRVALVTRNEPLAGWHRARLRDRGATDSALATIERFPNVPAASPREQAILRHTDMLTQSPGEAGQDDIAALKAAGLDPRDIVTISQLIGFLSFQVRLIAGLRLLAEEA